MSYIFLDESGDLGFNFKKKRTSGVFVISMLFSENKKSVEKVVKKIHSEMRKKYKRRFGVLHCVDMKPEVRQKLLKKINSLDIRLMTIYLNKRKVYTRLQGEKPVLYNYVTNILLDRICSKKIISLKDKITLVASKRETNKFLNDNFKEYLSNQIKNNHKLELEVVIKTPFEEKSLQAVDFVSWSVFRKYEQNDDSYYNIIKSKIVEENSLFL